MGKVKTQNHLHQQHVLARINFMYQASTLMAGQHNTLSSYYGELCKRIGQRANQRISPSIKRNMCRRCSLSLQPGVTAELATSASVNGNSSISIVNGDADKKHKRRRKRKRHAKKSNQATETQLSDKTIKAATEDATNNGDQPQLPSLPLEAKDIPKTTPIATAASTTIDEHTQMSVKCTLCGHARSFRVNSNYHFWLDNPDSVVRETVLKPKS